MQFNFRLSKQRLALMTRLLAASATLALGCEGADVTHPLPLPKPAAQVTSLSVSSVVASGHQGPNVPQNTLDNNLDTRWSAEGDGQWIQFDLGALTAVGRVDIAWYQQLPDTWESAFDIQVSSDAVNWTTVFSGRSTAGIVQHQGYGFPTVTCRYVRIVGHGQWDGVIFSSWWNSITEVDIYHVLPVTSVVASGHQIPNAPENTLDNNLDTRWSSEGDGQWIQYDLGASTAIGGVDIAWYQQLPDTWESAFDIQVSPDAITWTSVFSGRSTAGNLQHQRYEFSNVTARYVRIIGHGQWDGATFSSWWNSITEVDIHEGSGVPPGGPEPGPGSTIILQDGFEDVNNWGEWREMKEEMAEIGPDSRYSKTTSPVRSGTLSLQARYSGALGGTYGSITDSFPGVDEVYVKFHVMFEQGFQNPSMHFLVLAGDSFDGGQSSFGQAGRRPDCTVPDYCYFYAGLDPERLSGDTLQPFNFYTYWPDMDCPLDYNPALNRNCYGRNTGQQEPKIPLTAGVWHEVVFHVKLNTGPLFNDGSQALWINGVKKIDVQGLRWRTTNTLKLNRIRFDNWMPDGALSPTEIQHVWVDDLIVWRP